MLKRMDEEAARRCVNAAAASPCSQPGIDYPAWYLHRWHFLPEGYLSRRSAAMYEWCVRNVYYGGAEHRALGALRSALRLQYPGDVLELGCGPGHALEALADELPDSQITGVDLSPFQLERAQRRCTRFGERVQLLHGNALSLPSKDGTYEAVIAAHVAGHLPGMAADNVIFETERVLRPRGRLYLLEHAWHPLPATRLKHRWTQRLHRFVGRLVCYEKVD